MSGRKNNGGKPSKQLLPAMPSNRPPRRSRNRPIRRRNRRRGRANGRVAHPGLSKAGVNFLKCAFASPDFAVDPGQGIPDDYNGLALMRKDIYSNTIDFGAGMDTFILVAPMPGIAYWWTTAIVGSYPTQSSLWTPVFNTSFKTLFGDPTDQSSAFPIDPVERDENVTAFRFASLAVELTPTANFTKSAGSITIWKAPLSLTDTEVNPTTQTSAVIKTLNGASAVSREGINNKPFKFMDGAFAMAVNTEPTFNFEPVLSGTCRLPPVGVQPQSSPTFGQFYGDIIGLGHLQSIIVKVSSPTGSVNSGIIKVWSCIEYMPNPSSALESFAGRSPPLDPLALKMYRDISLKIPVAVTVLENDGFWSDRVLPLIRSFMNTARAVGGVVPQVGAVVSGVDALTSMFGLL